MHTNVTGTSSTGGAAGTGLLDIGNLNLPANSQLLIEFDITLVRVDVDEE